MSVLDNTTDFKQSDAEIIPDETSSTFVNQLQKLGNYKIIAKLGSGGFGSVYKAIQKNNVFERTVAIKILHKKYSSNKNSDVVKRFMREMHVTSQLQHKNIVIIYDANVIDNTYFLVLEYIEGKSLADVVRQDGPLSVDLAVRYLTEAVEALSYIHSKSIIHRDISPRNILIANNGCLKVLDLGLAKFDSESSPEEMTQTGLIMGSLPYLPIEAFEGAKNCDNRSDIYSLGCVFHFMLTGRSIYESKSILDCMLAHKNDKIPSIHEINPEIPPAVNSVFAKMVAKKPDDRYQNCQELLQAIKNINDESAQFLDWVGKSSIEKPIPNLPKIGESHKGYVHALIASFVVILSVIIGMLPQSIDKQASSDPNLAKVKIKTKDNVLPIANIPFSAREAVEFQDKTADYLKVNKNYLGPLDIKFILIPSGSLADGQKVEKPFYMGIYEVTNGQFEAFVKDTDYVTDIEKEGGPIVWDEVAQISKKRSDLGWRKKVDNLIYSKNLPVSYISYKDANAFCDWYTTKCDGKVICRLPTTREWEFACRGGTASKWFFGENVDNCRDYAVANKQTIREVGTLKANPFGIFDIYGNIAEYTDGDFKFEICGGHIWTNFENCNSEYRSELPGVIAKVDVGFRVLLRFNENVFKSITH